MGQCYSVYLKVKFNDEEGAKKALHDKISRGEEEHIRYDIEGLDNQHGFDLQNIRDLLSVFFSGWGSRLRDDSTHPGMLSSDFDCCYGWEGVMLETFSEIAPFLEDGSTIKIYPDSDYDLLEVKDGKAVMIH